MKQHNGMRPHDVVVLLKILISPMGWMGKDLAQDLKISRSEISESLKRSVISGLLDESKKKVRRLALLEFLQFGLPYVFPATRGRVAIGVATAYAAPVMAGKLLVSDALVWEYSNGNVRGETIEPLYPNAINAALADPVMYDILALVDILRLGKVREREIALKLLKNKFDSHHE